MLKVKTGMRLLGRLLVGTFVVVGLAGPSFAGNVYSWVTDDGTYAFTDDSKRIPAKHRDEAKRRPMGELARYERFTEVDVPENRESYEDRILARREALRDAVVAAPRGAVAGAVVAAGPSMDYTVAVTGGTTRSGRNGVSLRVPTGTQDGSDEPTTIESRRMDPSDSLATRHWTIVKQGDRVVSIIKGERRQRPLRAIPESDFDE